ncbi:MAG: rhodanese-like domain-containing protein [SAR202 cluster bacterium]|nr:rhodanese-like domain-containing protein [SAR202 cluster bacterium]
MKPTTLGESKTISRIELRQKLDRGDEFKLVLVLDEDAFRLKRIPGSIHIPIPFDPWTDLNELEIDDDIVVYCSGGSCFASKWADMALRASGYKNVRRYAGGIVDWEDAGYSLEREVELQTASAG